VKKELKVKADGHNRYNTRYAYSLKKNEISILFPLMYETKIGRKTSIDARVSLMK
jgi:hypothetical protein